MSYLVELLLPVTASIENREVLGLVRDELTARFGGATLHLDSPAEGLWSEGGEVERDRIVIAEVMVDDFDRPFWTGYKKTLEARLHQDEIVVRVTQIERL